MKSKDNDHPLMHAWNTYSGGRNEISRTSSVPPIERIIGEMFAIGEFYYYVLNLTDSTVSNHHPNILKLHGLSRYPQHLKEIIDLTHPDDIPFVIQAEQKVVEKMMEIGREHQLFLKSSYCFRMKTAAGNYELFHHQAVLTLEDENRNLIQSVNIHTNIHHITPENPGTVLVSGIGPRNDFHQIRIHLPSPDDRPLPVQLTRRENEVIALIAKGYTGSEIAKMLVLSEHTVRTHRKNILSKTRSRNSRELLKKAFEWGIL